LYSIDGIEAYGHMNLLKCGLVFSDAITTVSERYAQEIRSSEEYGAGLEGVVNKRKSSLTGILNGADYSVWDPSVDELIPVRYDARTLDQKLENKKALLSKMGLPFDPRIPVIGIISRLADQKGFDLIGEALDQLMKTDLQLAVLGTGEKKYHDLFEKAQRKFPKKVAVSLTFNNDLAHLIEAGSDMFLMPSRYEPCGLNQMYSLRYGTIPIVRATGGLDDTIEDVQGSSGTGFKFKEYDSGEMLKAIHRAVTAFKDQILWRKLMKYGMAKDFSWEASAKKYVQLYRSLART
jgi:starch synthase